MDTRRRGLPTASIVCGLGAVLLPLLPATGQTAVTAGTEHRVGVTEVVRKSLTYVPIRFRAPVPPAWRPRVEATVRRAVEQRDRFDINELGASLRGLDLQEIARLTREYVDRVKLERARERAEFDVRFKDRTVTAADLRRIAESAYLYVPTVLGWRVEHRVTRVKEGGIYVRVDVYTAKVAVEVRFYQVDFATGRAQERHRVLARGEGTESTRLPPRREAARREAIAEALAALEIDLRTRVRALPPFRLATNVAAATWNGAYIPLTRRDGLPLDSLLRVEEIGADDRSVTVGYLIVREVGDGEQELQSYAQIVATYQGWRLTGGELVYEEPQRGYRTGVALTWSAIAATGPEPGDPEAGAAYGLQLYAARDFAESTGIPELYTEGSLDLAVAGGYLLANVELGVLKRWSFRRLFWGIGARVGGLRVWTSSGGVGLEGTTFGVRGVADLSWWLTPTWRLYAQGSWRTYLPIFDLENDDGTYVLANDTGWVHPSGPAVSVGIVTRF